MMKSPPSPADSGGGGDGDAVKTEFSSDVVDVVIKEEPRSDPLESEDPVCRSGGEDLIKTGDVKVKEEAIDLNEPELVPDETIVKTEEVPFETPVTIKCDTHGSLKDETEENPFPDFDPEDEEAYQDFHEDSGVPSDPGQIFTGADQFRCYYCGSTYHKKSLLAVHVGSHLLAQGGQIDLMKHLCPYCDYRTFWPYLLKRHILTHMAPSFHCPVCPYQAKSKPVLTRHVKLHEGIQYKCPHCPYSSYLPSHLQIHVAARHKKGPVQCHFCEFTSLQANVRTHEKRKHKGEMHSCAHCSLKFASRRDLRLHALSEHRPMFNCYLCNFKTYVKSCLRQHVQTHVTPKEHKCCKRNRVLPFFTMDQL